MVSYTAQHDTESGAYKAVLSTIRNAAMPHGHAWAPALIYPPDTNANARSTVIGVRRDDDTPL